MKLAVVAAYIVTSLWTGSAVAQNSQNPTWRETKCARYGEAWRLTISKQGTSGLSAGFLHAHQEFLESGCETPASVCPQSREELAIANILVVRAMNAGSASTFLPFNCRRSFSIP